MKAKILPLFITISVILCGCGSSSEINNYKANMEVVFKNVSQIDSAINNIDSSQEGSCSTLLSYLDGLDSTFTQMANLDVPDGYPYVKELAVDASKNMSEAVSDYHLLLEAEEYNEMTEAEADALYKKANLELQYMIRILHGESYEDIISGASNTNEFETTSDEFEEDDYSMYLEEDDNDYSVYNDPNYQDETIY